MQVRFEEIFLLESQEKKINEQQHKLELLQSKSSNRGTRGRPRRNNKNAQGEGAPRFSITPVGGIGGLEHHHYYHLQDGDPSPHRNRQNSIDLKNEFEEKFHKTLSLLRTENSRLVDIEQAHGESIHVNEHQNHRGAVRSLKVSLGPDVKLDAGRRSDR